MFLQIIHIGPNDLALICAKPLRLPSFHGCHCPLQGDINSAAQARQDIPVLHRCMMLMLRFSDQSEFPVFQTV